MKYIALLRAINSGANPSQKMESLRKIFEDLGFSSVESVIASGNIIFESQEKNIDKLEKKIEKALLEKTGIDTPTIVWSIESLKKFYESEPFSKIETSKDLRPHVTFIKKSHEAKTFIVDMKTMKTPDVMRNLEKEYGREITTRTWMTVERILKKAL